MSFSGGSQSLAKWARIVLVAAILIACAALFVLSRRLTTSARVGNSILRVESMTIAPSGQVHTYFVAPLWRRKFDELWLRWIGPSPFPPPSSMSAGLSSDDDIAAALWVTRKINSSSIDPKIRKIEIIDEHGCVFTNAYTSPLTLSTVPTPLIIAVASFSALPRRERIFQTKIYCDDSAQPALLRLPNPFPRSFPGPAVQPLPIIHKQGNLEFVLTSFKIELSDKARRFYAGLEVRTNSLSPVAGWGEPDVEFEDCTGNHLRYEVCGHETAYKVIGRFYRSADARFDPTEIWKMKLKVPKTGECVSINQKHKLPNGEVSLWAIMADGKFQFSDDGTHTTIGPAPTIEKSWLYKSGPGGLQVRTEGIALLVPPGIPKDCRVLVRARDQEGRALTARAVRGARDYVIEVANQTNTKELELELMIEKPLLVEYTAHPELKVATDRELMSHDPDSYIVY